MFVFETFSGRHYPFKDQNHSPPTGLRQDFDILENHGFVYTKYLPRVLKTFLDSFRDRRHVFCCKNAVYKHDFTNESIDKTSKFTDFDQILPCYGVYTKILSLVITNIQKITSEMKRSRSVDSSRYQVFLQTPSEQKVINQNRKTVFFI